MTKRSRPKTAKVDRWVCAHCGDDLSQERIDQGEELICEHCRDLSDEEHDDRLIRQRRPSRWVQVDPADD